MSAERCAALECENTRAAGEFVGDFCAPCDNALRHGISGPGTSILFKLKEDRDSLLERLLDQLRAHEQCERCEQLDELHGPQCPDHPDHDPTPWCAQCGARKPSACHCGPIAENN